MAGDTAIHWFTCDGDETPTPFELVERSWGKAAVPLPYQIENGDYRITNRASELVATVPAREATAQVHDLGEVMWWIDDGIHLIPMAFGTETVIQ